jgi:hypothetical protein
MDALDLSAAVRSLKLSDGSETMRDLRWLEQSWEEPQHFGEVLASYAEQRLGMPGESSPSHGYAFYHDLVLRHTVGNGVAFRWVDGSGQWQELKYAALHEKVRSVAANWVLEGLEPGMSICLVLPMGLELFVGTVAALMMGLQVSYLPPLGPAFVIRRVAALAPDRVVYDSHFPRLSRELESWERSSLELSTPTKSTVHSELYGPGEAIGVGWSPLRHPVDQLVPIDAEALWRRALWDGLVVHGLGRSRGLCAPLMDPLRAWQGMYLASLICGATFIHVEREELAADPELLNSVDIHSLGVTVGLRDLVMEMGTSSLSCKVWFRDPGEELDWEKWREFTGAMSLSAVNCVNLYVEFGGGLLFSAKRKGNWVINQHVLPAPGAPWQLLDINGSGQESLWDSGVFAPGGETSVDLLLARRRSEWFFAGSQAPSRAVKTYPAEEVVEVVEALDGIEAASVVSLLPGEFANVARHHLLVFCGGNPVDQNSLRSTIRDQIRFELDATFLPDAVEILLLHVRRVEGSVDHDWCRQQFISGRLYRKAGNPLFAGLTKLRSSLWGLSWPP